MGLQWTLSYATASISAIRVTASSSAAAAGKSVSCAQDRRPREQPERELPGAPAAACESAGDVDECQTDRCGERARSGLAPGASSDTNVLLCSGRIESITPIAPAAAVNQARTMRERRRAVSSPTARSAPASAASTAGTSTARSVAVPERGLGGDLSDDEDRYRRGHVAPGTDRETEQERGNEPAEREQPSEVPERDGGALHAGRKSSSGAAERRASSSSGSASPTVGPGRWEPGAMRYNQPLTARTTIEPRRKCRDPRGERAAC